LERRGHNQGIAVEIHVLSKRPLPAVARCVARCELLPKLPASRSVFVHIHRVIPIGSSRQPVPIESQVMSEIGPVALLHLVRGQNLLLGPHSFGTGENPHVPGVLRRPFRASGSQGVTIDRDGATETLRFSPLYFLLEVPRVVAARKHVDTPPAIPKCTNGERSTRDRDRAAELIPATPIRRDQYLLERPTVVGTNEDMRRSRISDIQIVIPRHTHHDRVTRNVHRAKPGLWTEIRIGQLGNLDDRTPRIGALFSRGSASHRRQNQNRSGQHEDY